MDTGVLVADAVPFSPVPAHHIAIPFRGDDTEGPWSGFTFIASPIRVLWEECYRRAALDLAIGDIETAKEHALRGMAMEDAYIARVRAEARPVVAA